ncbi:type VI secretion system baseplate subunit TssF [Fluviispira vulneris]|uniref:type VI secretion system baseplate subunit TssF n=1 Tax=Fluviispira vulneris TaxID=2763012 RepID=UPI001645B97A|nr:type VI secretion system baseplate subunit TssF [Fluviispira vulneris]
MNIYQVELARLIEKLKSETNEIGKRNPNLFPALFAKGDAINDPETDRLVESFAYMMAQSNINFVDTSEQMSTNDLSLFLPEWFEPTVSSVILKPKIQDWQQWENFHIKENTAFLSTDPALKDEYPFSNDLPIQFSHIDIEESSFSVINGKHSLVLKFKTLADINRLGKIKIFLDYSKFNFYYRLLDNLILNKNKIEVLHKNEKFVLNPNAISYSFTNMLDRSIYTADNITYYLFQFINYMNNYCFLDIDFSALQMNIENNEEFIVIIPLDDFKNESLDIKNYAHTNCFSCKNYSINRGDPIYLQAGTKPFLTLDKASKKNFIGFDHIQFFDLNHKNVYLRKREDYRLIKKYTKTKNGLEIHFYLKILKKLEKDIIIVPYFKFSNLKEAHFILPGAKMRLKKSSRFEFTTISSPSKTNFYLNPDKNKNFYKSIFNMNMNLLDENIKFSDFMDALKLFSEITQYYKGIISKIIYQFRVAEEVNKKTQIHNVHGCFLHKRYCVTLEIIKKYYEFGGVTLIAKFIEALLNKTSKINSKYSVELRMK